MNFHYILHSMLAQKGANAIKIISVAVGLLVSILVFTRLDYNYSFDTFFRDRDNLYQIWMSYEHNGEKSGPYTSCPGKIGEGVVEALGDELEGATVMCKFPHPTLYKGDRQIESTTIGVDSLFFQTMGIELLSGNPLKDMTVPDVIYLSESLAEKIFGKGNPVDKTLSLNRERTLTVKGVFADIPTTTTMRRFDAAVSFPTSVLSGYRHIFWAGGDSWPCYMRLSPGSKLTIEEMDRRLNQMYQSHVPDTDTSKAYVLARPIRDTYLQYDSVKRMNLILWILGWALLLMTTLNYVLITIASLSRRAKAIGVYKCSGAGTTTIMAMFLWETLVILLCTVILMAALLFVFEPLITDTLSLSIGEIFTPSRLWVPAAVLLFFFLVGGLLPGRIFANIPVSQVFRRFTERNSAWKRSLLFVQIAGVMFVSGLLVIVTIQYREILNRDKGFSSEGLAAIFLPTIDHEMVKTTVSSLSYIEKITSGMGDPVWGYSGQNIGDGEGNIIFNTRLGWMYEGYTDVMGIEILEGREPKNEDEVIINQEFARKMGWGGDAVGQIINDTRSFNTPVKVVGLMKDFTIQGFASDIRPLVLIPTKDFQGTAYIKVRAPFDKNLRQLEKFFEDTYPSYEFEIYNLDEENKYLYKDVLLFRNSALIATVALIFISLMGLIGFARDEVQRRSKEIAIRKVNGAEGIDIINMITADILRIAVPAVILGTLLAAYVGHIWLSNFIISAPHVWLWYLLTAIAVLFMVTACVIIISLRVAADNPVNHLKSE